MMRAPINFFVDSTYFCVLWTWDYTISVFRLAPVALAGRFLTLQTTDPLIRTHSIWVFVWCSVHSWYRAVCEMNLEGVLLANLFHAQIFLPQIARNAFAYSCRSVTTVNTGSPDHRVSRQAWKWSNSHSLTLWCVQRGFACRQQRVKWSRSRREACQGVFFGVCVGVIMECTQSGHKQPLDVR